MAIQGSTENTSNARGLVSSRISQHPGAGIKVFNKGIKFQARKLSSLNQPVPPDRTKIQGFSDNSRRRLRFVAVNAFPELTSQFCLTYHNDWPADGAVCKAHLNAFLTSFRRKFPGVGYLWLLEFQKRNAPHYHLFTSLPVTEENHVWLAETWCRITMPNDAEALAFHLHDKNFIAWDMGHGHYVAKYLEKSNQKLVPDGYSNVGRFWGASRGLVPMPVEVDYDAFGEAYSQVDLETGELKDGLILATRWLGRWYEKQFNVKRKRNNYFRKHALNKGYTLVTGAEVFYQIERYLSKRRLK